MTSNNGNGNGNHAKQRYRREHRAPDSDTSRPRVVSGGFEDSEGLRALLHRLHVAGPGAWRHDPEAAELMAFAAHRYARLAAKYGQTREDAAAAAFDAMLNPSTRNATDPWAVVTYAVRITLIAEHRANGLLTSTARARRPEYSVFHDAERFSDHESDLTDYHPAFRIPAPADDASPDQSTNSGRAGRDSITFLTLLGWDRPTVTNALEYVCSRLPDFGDRVTAYDALRRDKTARVLLDLPHDAWIGLLRLILGNPTATTSDARRGLLARLLIEETIPDLLADHALVAAAIASRPTTTVQDGAGR